jgi:predicted nucleic acid-binding protein
MLYVDSSAFSKRYLEDEEHHDELVETPRALFRTTPPLTARQLTSAFDTEVLDSLLVDIDQVTLAMARDVAVETGVRSLDAIHLASALRVADGSLAMLTYDKQQAAAAEQLGLRLAR